MRRRTPKRAVLLMKGPSHDRVAVGTHGVVLARRDDGSVLVKFHGHGTPRHCTSQQVKVY